MLVNLNVIVEAICNVILEHAILNNLEEPIEIEELVDIKRFYLKSKELAALKILTNEPEPI